MNIAQDTPPNGYDAHEFDLIVALKSDGATMDVTMFSPKGQGDLSNPAIFFGDWLASNWEQIQAMCATAYALRNAAAKPALELVSADGQTL